MASLVQRTPVLRNLFRFDPFHNDDWLKCFWLSPFAGEMEAAPRIKINLTENDKLYFVRAEIPGLKKRKFIKVNVDGNRVSISAEVKQEKEGNKGEKTICRESYPGSSYRSFSLDCNVDESNIQAKYYNGVLKLTLPKKNGNGARQPQIK